MPLLGSVGRCHFGYRVDVREKFPQARSWDDAIRLAEREMLGCTVSCADLRRMIRSFRESKAGGEPFPEE